MCSSDLLTACPQICFPDVFVVCHTHSRVYCQHCPVCLDSLSCMALKCNMLLQTSLKPFNLLQLLRSTEKPMNKIADGYHTSFTHVVLHLPRFCSSVFKEVVEVVFLFCSTAATEQTSRDRECCREGSPFRKTSLLLHGHDPVCHQQ